MANRMIVVPEEAYENLLSSRNNVLGKPLDNKIREASDKVTNILHSRGKNPTEKFAAYDQEVKNVRKFMSQRNEHQGETNLQDLFDNFLQKLQQVIVPQAPTPA